MGDFPSRLMLGGFVLSPSLRPGISVAGPGHEAQASCYAWLISDYSAFRLAGCYAFPE